jgi:hypothetical protein
MKFKQFYESVQLTDETIKKFLNDFRFVLSSGHFSRETPIEKAVTADGISSDMNYITIYSKSNVPEFYWPFPKHSPFEKITLNVFGEENSMVVKNFYDIPDTKILEIDRLVITSMNGTGLQHLEELWLNFNTMKFECGLIGLLKLPKLQQINAVVGVKDDDNKLLEAMRIVRKHLASKNIAECMDELMEAGLKEYAKM